MTDDLATRIEAASAEKVGALLEKAFLAAFPYPSGASSACLGVWREQKADFDLVMSVSAYADAAMMLIPEGWVIAGVRQRDDGGNPFHVTLEGNNTNATAFAPTLAQAIAAASVRARASSR